MEIYYFTRSGRSKQIAEELAAMYQTKAKSIVDGKNWSGVFGYLNAGRMSAMGKRLPASYQKTGESGPVAVVFPVWAGGFPPAVRTFVEEMGRGRLIAIPTSLGSTLKDRQGFLRVIDLVGKTIVAPKSLD